MDTYIVIEDYLAALQPANAVILLLEPTAVIQLAAQIWQLLGQLLPQYAVAILVWQRYARFLPDTMHKQWTREINNTSMIG